ncbi:hypothetical protein SISSUDRAFT_780090 [Sistotremastrum suecicum HHB10207 ss-3]|uniref:Uncharacterized protein n=1 Tax=Sistotremastrum suecicum HHB10207 ss-3 TaxID=1314776 RepID=A0A166D3W1_9AGAM|nr:hypothetical protein SISSUDRAFT_780090 [Sistotremastrum suecicum HHB10207 ss-3]
MAISAGGPSKAHKNSSSNASLHGVNNLNSDNSSLKTRPNKRARAGHIPSRYPRLLGPGRSPTPFTPSPFASLASRARALPGPRSRQNLPQTQSSSNSGNGIVNQPTQIRDGIPTRPCERCVKSAKMCVLGYDGRRCRACIGSRKGCSLTGLRYPRYNKGGREIGKFLEGGWN